MLACGKSGGDELGYIWVIGGDVCFSFFVCFLFWFWSRIGKIEIEIGLG